MIGFNNIDICKVCGALVWWEQVDKHAGWHRTDPPTEEER